MRSGHGGKVDDVMMNWRIRYEVLGGHVHCKLFCAPMANRTFALCGEFVVGTAELEDLQNAFPGAEFIGDINVQPKEN